MTVLLDELAAALVEKLHLPMPSDDGLRTDCRRNDRRPVRPGDGTGVGESHRGQRANSPLGLCFRRPA